MPWWEGQLAGLSNIQICHPETLPPFSSEQSGNSSQYALMLCNEWGCWIMQSPPYYNTKLLLMWYYYSYFFQQHLDPLKFWCCIYSTSVFRLRCRSGHGWLLFRTPWYDVGAPIANICSLAFSVDNISPQSASENASRDIDVDFWSVIPMKRVEDTYLRILLRALQCTTNSACINFDNLLNGNPISGLVVNKYCKPPIISRYLVGSSKTSASSYKSFFVSIGVCTGFRISRFFFSNKFRAYWCWERTKDSFIVRFTWVPKK